MEEPPIVVVGGGLGGLGAAFCLSLAGYSVHVLERAPEIKEVGAGVQLGPNVFRVLDKLGIADDVRRRTVFPDDLVMMDIIGARTVTSIPLRGRFQKRFPYPYGLIHRADLLQVLVDHCSKCPSIKISTSTNVVGFDNKDDRVIIHTENGDQYVAAAMIGADGIASVVRSKLLGDGPARKSGYVACRSVVAAAEFPKHLRNNAMTLWAGPRHHLVHYPLRNHSMYNLVAAFRSDNVTEGWDGEGDARELHAHFESAAPEIQAVLQRVETWRMWVLCDRDPIENWSAGRVTLLGDAAHPMLQYLGQGAGMAIEDAYILAESVAASRGDYSSAFLKYQTKRYLRTGRAQLTSRLYGEFFHAAGAAREIRNQFLRGRAEEDACESLAWLYDGPELSTLVT